MDVVTSAGRLMGTLCSTNGEGRLRSQFKTAAVHAGDDFSGQALGPDQGVAPGGQKDAVWDVHTLEAALAEHHLALRRFVCEWVDSQEQLLSLRTKRVIDARVASSSHSSSNTDSISSADGKKPCRRLLQTKDTDRKNLPEQELTQVVANHEILAVPVEPRDMSEQQQESRYGEGQVQSRCRLPQGKTQSLKMVSVASSQEPWFARALEWQASTTIFSNIDAKLNRSFPCPLLNRIESSNAFNTCCSLVIVVNAITMALAADYDMHNFQQPGNRTLQVIECVFVAIYTIELGMRIMVKKLAFLRMAWSWFDAVIVGVGWIEVASIYGASFTQVRLVRILKMMKVMRVLRVMRSFREVRMLLNSLMGSVKPLFWTMIIITATNFVFGIYFVQTLAMLRHDSWTQGGTSDGQLESEQLGTLLSPWTSVMQAMYTLFKVSTGGLSWGDISDLLLQTGWQTFSIFILYMALFMFVIFNAVTSVFVAATEEYAAKDSETMLRDQLSKKEKYVKQVFSLYEDIAGDTCGEVTKEQFMNYIHDPRMCDFARTLEIDSLDLEQFFDVLSSKGGRGVDLDTFVDGCIRLRGTAKSMDVYDLLVHQQVLAKEVGCIRSFLEQHTPKAQI